MGQKAKNAGKKASKTCNKLANTKSVKCSGARLKVFEKTMVWKICDSNGNISEEFTESKIRNTAPQMGVISHKIDTRGKIDTEGFTNYIWDTLQ